MNKDILVIPLKEIENRIFTIRGLQVMLDSHLAEMYEIETKVFNQAVKRNINRFPDNFRFQLSEKEWDSLMSQIVTIENSSLWSQNATFEKGRGKHRKYLPYAFTENGVAMLASVLRSETAIKVSIAMIDGMKDSVIDLIPKEWKVQSIGEKFKFSGEKSSSKIWGLSQFEFMAKWNDKTEFKACVHK